MKTISIIIIALSTTLNKLILQHSSGLRSLFESKKVNSNQIKSITLITYFDLISDYLFNFFGCLYLVFLHLILLLNIIYISANLSEFPHISYFWVISENQHSAAIAIHDLPSFKTFEYVKSDSPEKCGLLSAGFHAKRSLNRCFEQLFGVLQFKTFFFLCLTPEIHHCWSKDKYSRVFFE